jgi:hypothetical protein
VAEERKVVHISIRFKPQDAAALKAIAEEENRSINGTVVEAVQRYIRSRPQRTKKTPPQDR